MPSPGMPNLDRQSCVLLILLLSTTTTVGPVAAQGYAAYAGAPAEGVNVAGIAGNGAVEEDSSGTGARASGTNIRKAPVAPVAPPRVPLGNDEASSTDGQLVEAAQSSRNYRPPPPPTRRDARSQGECQFDPAKWRQHPQSAAANAVMFDRSSGLSCSECLQRCAGARFQNPRSMWICRSLSYDHQWRICDLFAVNGTEAPYFLLEYSGRDYFEFLAALPPTDSQLQGHNADAENSVTPLPSQQSEQCSCPCKAQALAEKIAEKSEPLGLERSNNETTTERGEGLADGTGKLDALGGSGRLNLNETAAEGGDIPQQNNNGDEDIRHPMVAEFSVGRGVAEEGANVSAPPTQNQPTLSPAVVAESSAAPPVPLASLPPAVDSLVSSEPIVPGAAQSPSPLPIAEPSEQLMPTASSTSESAGEQAQKEAQTLGGMDLSAQSQQRAVQSGQEEAERQQHGGQTPNEVKVDQQDSMAQEANNSAPSNPSPAWRSLFESSFSASHLSAPSSSPISNIVLPPPADQLPKNSSSSVHPSLSDSSSSSSDDKSLLNSASVEDSSPTNQPSFPATPPSTVPPSSSPLPSDDSLSVVQVSSSLSLSNPPPQMLNLSSSDSSSSISSSSSSFSSSFFESSFTNSSSSSSSSSTVKDGEAAVDDGYSANSTVRKAFSSKTFQPFREIRVPFHKSLGKMSRIQPKRQKPLGRSESRQCPKASQFAHYVDISGQQRVLTARRTGGAHTEELAARSAAECMDACDNPPKLANCNSAVFSASGCTLSSSTANHSAPDSLASAKGTHYLEKICLDAALSRGEKRRVFPAVVGYILVGHVQEVSSAGSLAECLKACLLAESSYGFACKSVMFYPTDVDQNCLMNSESRHTQAEVFVQEEPSVHMLYVDTVPHNNSKTAVQSEEDSQRRFKDLPLEKANPASANQTWTRWSKCLTAGGAETVSQMRHRYLKCRESKDVRKCPKESVPCKKLSTLRIQRIGRTGQGAASECLAVRDALGVKRCPYGIRWNGTQREFCSKPIDC